MKPISLLWNCGSAAAVLAAVTLGPSIALTKEKSDVCHATGDGTYRLINISENAVQAHLDHGDVFPGTIVGGTDFVGDDCGLTELIEAVSPELVFGPMGWGGWSCPAGTIAVSGGYEPAEATVLTAEVAEPGSSLYPDYPHHSFDDVTDPPETGFVVQNDNDQETLEIFVLCLPV